MNLFYPFRLSSMWGTICLVLWMFAWTAIGAPSISTVCPEDCECTNLQRSGIKAHCSSLDFLSKLRPKQIQEITELNLSDLAMQNIDTKLRKLRNLKRLDLSKNNIEDLNNFPQLPQLTHLYLSNNRIKQFTASDLPKSIKHLDISSNHIALLTDILKYLPNLREINMNDNILTCDCVLLKNRDVLLRNDVHIVRPANCYTPENVRGISLLSAYCVSGKVTYDDLGQMLADEPGSGDNVEAIGSASISSDILDFEATEKGTLVDDDLDGDYFATKANISSTNSDPDDNGEGSGGLALFDVGEEGSGDEFIPVSPNPNVPHCYYNCSTPPPINDTSEPPVNIGQEIWQVLDDITGKSTTTPAAATTTTTTLPPPVKEIVHQQSAATLSETRPEKQSETGHGSRAGVDAPKQSQTTEDVSKKNNTTTYVVVGVLFFAMVALVLYVVVRRRRSANQQNNRRPASNHEIKEPVEMKPLMTTQAQPYKPPNPILEEKKPLMNGQNGTNKKSEDDPVEDQHNQQTDEPDGGKLPPVENGVDTADVDEAQMRPKKEEDALLTPGTKRVTIQAKELSSPKSPVLVHRHVGDDGKIISSPVSNNDFKYT